MTPFCTGAKCFFAALDEASLPLTSGDRAFLKSRCVGVGVCLHSWLVSDMGVLWREQLVPNLQ